MAPFETAPSRLDSHCHLWRRARGDYTWLENGDPTLQPLRRDFELDHLREAAGAGGVDRCVLVQAAATVAETEWLLRQAGAAPDLVAGVVGWVDLSDPAAAATIAELARDRRFLGVRPMLQDEPDADWIATQPAAEAVAALFRHGLRFDALVTPRELPALLRFVERHPELPMMIDHAAKPFRGGADRPAGWRDAMRVLAAAPSVSCKLSGLVGDLSPARRDGVAATAATLAPLFDELLEWFGPDRLCWGSDWPVAALAEPPEVWAAVTDRLLAGLAPGERDAILRDTAIRFYGLVDCAR